MNTTLETPSRTPEIGDWFLASDGTRSGGLVEEILEDGDVVLLLPDGKTWDYTPEKLAIRYHHVSEREFRNTAPNAYAKISIYNYNS